MNYKKKLIEVALPLEAINRAASKEKSIRHGHPSTLHLWWARRPLAACRAVIFASLVNDPGEDIERFPTAKAQEKERKRLWSLIERLVDWNNINDEKLLKEAHEEILKSNNGIAPAIYDPFCGGGSIPVEAQRLGLQSFASDLNPVAVLMTKAQIEIPFIFQNKKAVQSGQLAMDVKSKTSGIAIDLQYYGNLVRDLTEEKLKDLYPKPKNCKKDEKPVVWLWARTVESPNPALKGVLVPLIKSFIVEAKKDEFVWLEPKIEKRKYSFSIKNGKPKNLSMLKQGTKTGRGANFKCLISGTTITPQYIKEQGKAGKIGATLLAVVCEGPNGRRFIESDTISQDAAFENEASWVPDQKLAHDPKNIWCVPYGIETFSDLFTQRQLVVLEAFTETISKVHSIIESDAKKAGFKNSSIGLEKGSDDARAYADAIVTYLAFALNKCTDYWNSLVTWMPRGTVGHLFARQAIAMSWDFPEANPFADNFHCSWKQSVSWVCKAVENINGNGIKGNVFKASAQTAIKTSNLPSVCVSTDPPYYDNISYSDLSDFFYVWTRKMLRNIYPETLSTILTPKDEELVASPYRFNGEKERAAAFFENGLGEVFKSLKEKQTSDIPITIYYAFKQTEDASEFLDEENASEEMPARASTGWETMLEGIISSKLMVTGTIPLRTERTARSVAQGTNALATSVVLVCRPRPEKAKVVSRREFLSDLKSNLKQSIAELQKSAIAPVDLQQAAIGPGMAIYSKYKAVLESNDTPMTVRSALVVINQVLDEIMNSSDANYDSYTKWALSWFEQHGFGEGTSGDANALAQARNVSVDSLKSLRIVSVRGSKVSLIKRNELKDDWAPANEKSTVWTATQYLVRALEEGGENAAASILISLKDIESEIRELSYFLFSICEKKNWSQEAIPYNSLVSSWSEIVSIAGRGGFQKEMQFKD